MVKGLCFFHDKDQEYTGVKPDIDIIFASGAHSNQLKYTEPASESFDGAGGVLAHAFRPNAPIQNYHGDTHFDAAETWVKGGRKMTSNGKPAFFMQSFARFLCQWFECQD